MKGVGPKSFAKKLFQQINDHNTTDSAAQLSYYFLLALFPLLFCLVAVAAYLPLGGAVDDLMYRLSQVMPRSAMEIVKGHLDTLIHEPKPNLLTIGLLATLWSASRGVDALRKGLNFAYDVKESRPWWRTNGAAILMTVVGSFLVLLAVAGIALGGKAGDWLAAKVGVEKYYKELWAVLRWPVTAILVMLAAALIYFLLPDVKTKFKFITPGSIVGTILWIAATFGFTQYAEHFGNYNATYGSIGGVIVLMTWLYISGLIFLVGGEVNALIEHLSPDGKAPGAHAEGEAPLPPSERPSAGQGKDERPLPDAETGNGDAKSVHRERSTRRELAGTPPRAHAQGTEAAHHARMPGDAP